MYCVTEQQFVTLWSQTKPTHCPNGIDHVIQLDNIGLIETVSPTSTITQNQTTDVFNNTVVTQKTNLFDIKAMFGYSALRDNTVTTGGATLTNNPGEGEFKFTTTSASNDSVSLVTVESGKYLAGASAEVGIAVRIPHSFLGKQEAKWGYFDNNNGFYFKKTSTDFYVCILRDGIETTFNNSEFNIDKLDGTGISGTNLNFEIGNIFKINYSWYGYGFVKFFVQGRDLSNGITTFLPIHAFQTLGQTSIKNPCLPISCELNNNGESLLTDVTNLYVTGRQYSIIEQYTGHYREQGILITPSPICLITMTPIMSLKMKTNIKGCQSILKSIFAKASFDTYIEIRVFTTLTNESFIDIPNSESVMQYDKTASTAIGGIKIWSGVVGNNNSFISIDSEITITQLTVFGMSLDTSNSSILNYFHLNWKEAW
jgi:hypothetical protein